jgi:acyl carrier protein
MESGRMSGEQDPHATIQLMTDIQPIRRFLRDYFRIPRFVSLGEDEELLPNILDGISVFQVADFVEESYGIQLEREDLLQYETHFRSLKAIASLIERKRFES